MTHCGVDGRPVSQVGRFAPLVAEVRGVASERTVWPRLGTRSGVIAMYARGARCQ